MEQKVFPLVNKGMNRDLSVSKAGESSAFENHNIRIVAREEDTMLSVTNERGNKEIPIKNIVGELVGWNVLNSHVILFCHGNEEDYIYRVDYDGNKFNLKTVFHGNLGFDAQHPIESVVYFETDNIQKIYWLDGIHVLRFMNFMDEDMIASNWNDDNTAFDSNRSADASVKAEITKDNSGNSRANGTIQYFLTYYNKHGQQTGIIWSSDLIYLAPVGRGGAADETNNNKVTLIFKDLDTDFTHFRVYCVTRSSYNGEAVAYIVGDAETSDEAVTIIDDGSHLTLIDTTSLLYLGSQHVIAGTMAHKDETLFIGDLKSIGHEGYDKIDVAVKSLRGDNGIINSDYFQFVYSDDTVDGIHDIALPENAGSYSYLSQLQYSSSEILSFKGNEKYRFGLKFLLGDGTETQAFWIGDAINTLYPKIDTSTGKIKRIVAKLTLPSDFISVITDESIQPAIKAAQLVMAEATYADRAVKAQGIINPTMFNTWERYNNRVYSQASWVSRPRGSQYANRHFEAIHKSNTTTGEIQCSFWHDDVEMNPYFQYYADGSGLVGKLEGTGDYDLIMYVFSLDYIRGIPDRISSCEAYVVTLRVKNGTPSQYLTITIPSLDSSSWTKERSSLGTFDEIYTMSASNYKMMIYHIDSGVFSNFSGTAIEDSYAGMMSALETYGFSVVVSKESWRAMVLQVMTSHNHGYFNTQFNLDSRGSVMDAINYTVGSVISPNRWIYTEGDAKDTDEFRTSYYKKHAMFVDENVVTMNSPEIEYEAVSLDDVKYNFRIVGVAKMTGVTTDYTIDATPGAAITTSNVVQLDFTADRVGNVNRSIPGLITWPLWKDNDIVPKEQGRVTADNEEDRTSSDYVRGTRSVYYWMYLWGKIGNITAYRKTKDADDDSDATYDEVEPALLQKKRVANQRFAYNTIYSDNQLNLDLSDSHPIRQFDSVSSRLHQISVAGETRFYDGIIQQMLTVPGLLKYPVYYSMDTPYQLDADKTIARQEETITIDGKEVTVREPYYLFVQDPVMLEYRSNPHAVITLKTTDIDGVYNQTILPYVFDSERIITDTRYDPARTGWLLPWIDFGTYPRYKTYSLTQEKFNISGLSSGDSYMFIGEIYRDFSPDDDYGGISDFAIQNNRFIPAGPRYSLDEIAKNNVIYGNQGDTYFQRWDCVKTLPYSDDAVYGVTDITSVMLETHINIDGRTDRYRGGNKLTSYDYTVFGTINPAYSQPNNFVVSRDLDEDFNTDAYRSSLTWTLPKADMAVVDEWSHITLASSLKLDGDKGICQALRRFQNSIVAFQDRGIAEVLFNSRTQLSTTDGVPVELANSGKVDGKRYISNKYGCINKWSIVEGKRALYFIDNINKSFCAFTGNVESLSSRLGFSAWFRKNNSIKPWTPEAFENIVSFYDRIHSDVYLVKASDNDRQPCLVYNEAVGAFTSFFDYSHVPMMANVSDRFISFRDNKLWLQNEGFYCNFFGKQYDFWMKYRVTPEPYSDKIWTNIEYRADFYRVLDENGNSTLNNEQMLEDLEEIDYQPIETFDSITVSNEYQTTGEYKRRPLKKFRIWRYVIPRAVATDNNIYGLDRIRNPWANILFKKAPLLDENRDLVQLHDFLVYYFE